jgi:ABC-2 type transport system permease protein
MTTAPSRSFFLSRILAQCVKELAQFRRDPITVALAFLLPVGAMLIYGYAIRLEAKNIPLAIQDLDHTPLSRDYTAQFFATNQYVPAQWEGSDPAHDAIDKGRAKAALIIPPTFSRDLTRGQPVTVQVLVDGTDGNNARVVKNSVKAVTRAFLEAQGLQPVPTQGITARIRLWFNPGRQEAYYIVPGVYGVLLWIFPSLLTSLSMVREKEQGTVIQVYASSLSAAEWLAGKGLAYFLVAMAQATLLMLVGGLLFHVGFVGDPTPLLVGAPLFLGVAVSFGLFVGAGANNQSAAVQNVSTAGFLTALLLSGFIYPVSNIPFPLSIISALVPVRHFIELTRDAFVRGTGWPGVWYIPFVLSGLGSLLFFLAWRKLRPMQFSN